jgi:hypothetical protein
MPANKKRGPGPSHLLLTPDHAGNVVGVDPHKLTLTATVLDPRGGVLAGEHPRGPSGPAVAQHRRAALAVSRPLARLDRSRRSYLCLVTFADELPPALRRGVSGVPVNRDAARDRRSYRRSIAGIGRGRQQRAEVLSRGQLSKQRARVDAQRAR